jgi:hypothetical protein
MSEPSTSAKARGGRTRAAVTRRRVITSGLTAAAAVSGTAAALHPVLAADEPEAHADAAPQAAAAPLFDEVYRGRRIQGFTDSGEDGVAITVDGTRLPVMRRVDGSWISTANHYQPYTTPLATARGAVDVIGRAPLSAAGPAEHHH